MRDGMIVSEERQARVCVRWSGESKPTAAEVFVSQDCVEWFVAEGESEGAVLRFSSWRMERELVAELYGGLLSSAGVLPEDVEVDGDEVDVRLLPPDRVGASSIEWRVRDGFWLVQYTGGIVHFRVDVESDAAGVVRLSGTETWRFARALVSSRVVYEALVELMEEADARFLTQLREEAGLAGTAERRAPQAERIEGSER